VTGHSGKFTPGGYLSTVIHTTLAGNKPTTFQLCPMCYQCGYLDHQDFSADFTVAVDQFRTNTNLEQFGPKPIFIELFITSWMFKELLV